MRCVKCFDAFVQKEYVPKIHDGRASGLEKRQRAVDVLDDKGHHKRKKRTDCKHCGRTDHVMGNSNKCPLNKKSPIYDPNFVADTTTAPTANVTDEPDTATTAPTANATDEPDTTTTAPTSNATDEPDTTTTAPTANATDEPDTTTTAPTANATDEPDTTTTTPTAPAPPVLPTDTVRPITPVLPTFQVGDCCVAQWHRRQWFLAHVTSVGPAFGYEVYFPGDGQTKKCLRRDQLRSCDGMAVAPVRRGALINSEWLFPGDNDLEPGMFRVRRIEGNTYVCTRLTGGGSVNMDNFDIGYVMGRLRDAQEMIRRA